MLHIGVSRTSSGGFTMICCTLLVLWMTQYWHIMARNRWRKKAYTQSDSPGAAPNRSRSLLPTVDLLSIWYTFMYIVSLVHMQSSIKADHGHCKSERNSRQVMVTVGRNSRPKQKWQMVEPGCGSQKAGSKSTTVRRSSCRRPTTNHPLSSQYAKRPKPGYSFSLSLCC